MIIRHLSRLINSMNMKGISIKEFGGPEVCKLYDNLPIPEPNDNQVGRLIKLIKIETVFYLKIKIQIKIHAAGVNPVDTYIRSGTHSR